MPTAHWLDHAKYRYGEQLVEDVKVLLRILLLYVPLPIFWALFDQQGSRWTFQASRMDGRLPGGLTIKPDQMQVVNPVLIIAFIPLWDACVYPLLARIGLRRPLQKLAVGMVLVAVSFVMSALLEQQLERLDPRLPAADHGQWRVINGMPNAIRMITDDARVPPFLVAPMSMSDAIDVPLPGSIGVALPYTVEELHSNGTTTKHYGRVHLKAGEAVTHFATWRTNRTQMLEYVDVLAKPTDDQPLLRVLFTTMQKPLPRSIVMRANKESNVTFTGDSLDLVAVEAGLYDILVDGVLVDDRVQLESGGVYVYLLSEWDVGNFVSW